MAASCLYLKPDALLGLSPLARLWKLVPSSSHGGGRPELGRGGSSRRRRKRRQVAVASVHSNPRILKTNRRTSFGLAVSPYDDEEEEEIGEDGEEEDEEKFDFSDVGTLYLVFSMCYWFKTFF